MALQLNYSSLADQYRSNKPTAGVDTPSSVNINVPQLAPITMPLADVVFESGTTVATQDGTSELGLILSGNRVKNASSKPSLIFNADRVIINSKQDYTMLFGQKGVAISSPNKVNIDAEDSITLFAENNLYLGVPNKGQGVPPDSKNPNPSLVKRDSSGNINKASATKDYEYEPLVLGLKLANWLDDLIQTMKNAILLTPVGKGYFREDTQYDLIALQARIKEMLSTYAFVDGYSHEQPDIDTLPAAPRITETPSTNLTGEVTGVTYNEGLSDSQDSTPTDNLVTQPDYFETNQINAPIK